jgi:hypothetical protein
MTLEGLEVEKGVDRAAVERLIRAHLSELEACAAVTFLGDPYFEPIDFETADDLVTVVVGNEDGTRYTKRGRLAYWDCVAVRVDEWPWREVLKDAAPEQAVSFSYRYRPSAAVLEAMQKSRAETWARYCKAFDGATAELPIDAKGGLLERFLSTESWLLARNDAVSNLILKSSIFTLMRKEPSTPREFAGNMREISAMLDLQACQGLRGWSALEVREVLDTPGRPTVGCKARVAALRAAADARHPPSFANALASDRARPLPADAHVVDLLSRRPGQYRPDRKELEAIARKEKGRGKGRPVIYLSLDPNMHATFAAEVASLWSAMFEVRLIVGTKHRAEASGLRATAWPAAVKLWEQQLARHGDLPLSAFLLAAPDEARFCAQAKGVLDSRAPDRRAERLASDVADDLERCGCPDDYAEAVFARAAVAIDALDRDNGWIPWNVSESPRAPEVSLDSAASVADLESALRDTPIRLRFR